MTQTDTTRVHEPDTLVDAAPARDGRGALKDARALQRER